MVKGLFGHPVLYQFLVKYGFPFPILRFLPKKSLKLLKDRFLNKMLLRRENTNLLPFSQNYGLK